MNYRCVALACVGAVTIASTATPQSISFLAGDRANQVNSSEATAVSSDGRVSVGVGVMQSTATTLYDPIRWTTTGTPSLLWAPGGQGAASAVNSDGTVIVGTDGPGGYGVARAVRWTPAGIQRLGFLTGTNESGATGVSADGNTIVGVCSGLYTTDIHVAFSWTATGGMRRLETPTGATNTVVRGISADARVGVGWYQSSRARYDAARWDLASGNWSPLPPTTGWSFAIASNADGTVIVGQASYGTQSELFASTWVNGGAATPIGDVTLMSKSQANACSADGRTIVGTYTPVGSRFESAFVWTPDLGFTDLNTLALSLGVDLGGLVLARANGISADGLTIVGAARTANGQGSPGFVLNIPAPPVVATPALAAAFSCRRKRRTHRVV